MITVTRNFILGVALAAVALSCRRQDDAAPVPTLPAESITNTAAGSGNESNASLVQAATGRSDIAASDVAGPAPVPAAGGLAEELKALRLMEQEGDFAEALTKARELENSYRADPGLGELRSLLAQLSEEKRAASELVFAARSLGADDVPAARVAHERLLEDPETAKIVVRRILRQDADAATARGCAAFLVENGDKASIPIMIEYFIKHPDSGIHQSIAAGLNAMDVKISAQQLIRLMDLNEGLPEAATQGVKDAVKDITQLLLEKAAHRYELRGRDDIPPDGDVGGLFAEAMAGAYRAGDQATAGKFRKVIPRDAEKPLDLVGSFEGLLNDGVPATVLLRVYRPAFYHLVKAEKKSELSAMIRVGDKLFPLLSKDIEQNQLRSMVIDGAFTVGNYAEALRLLKQGMPDEDNQWSELAIAKVEGILAESEGRTNDAIVAYRAAITNIARNKRQDIDPTTGMLHSCEMMLGHSYRKIGDLLLATNDKEKALLDYAEARRYFGLALKTHDPESNEAAYIAEELSKLPPEAP